MLLLAELVPAVEAIAREYHDSHSCPVRVPSVLRSVHQQLAQADKVPLAAVSCVEHVREKHGELFGKNLSSAGAFLAEETTHIKDEMNWMPTRRKVMQYPTVMALDVRGDSSTLRTTRCWGRDTSHERDLIGNVNLLNEYFRKVKKGGRGCQMGESPLLRENCASIIPHLRSAELRKNQRDCQITTVENQTTEITQEVFDINAIQV